MSDYGFPLSFALYTQGLPFHGGPIENQSLGGSESAVWFLSRELAKLGHHVEVYCQCPHPGDYGGAWYYPVEDFNRMAMAKEWDVFVAVRFFTALALPLRAKQMWLALHDMPGAMAKQCAAHCFQTDQVIPLSNFHQDSWVKEFDGFAPKMWQSRNGVDLELLGKYGTAKRNPKRLIYASRPERGLDYLLAQIWPRLHQLDPQLELVICGYDMRTYDFPPNLREFYRQMDTAVAQSPGVTNAGPLTKAQFYKLLSSCAAMTYTCSFQEVSCIAALEAMSLGVPVVTSDAYALKETIPYDLVPGTPHDPGYAERFIAQTITVLQNELVARRLRHQGRKWVEEKYQWSHIAKEWEARAYELFAERFHARGKRIAETLLFNSDVVAAHDLAVDSGFMDIEAETQTILDNHHKDPEIYSAGGHLEMVPQTWAGVSSYVAQLIPALPPPMKDQTLTVLDVGCGGGQAVAAIAKARADAMVHGIDFSPSLIAKATQLAQEHGLSDRVRFTLEDFLHDDSRKSSYDVVVCTEVLEHVIDSAQLIDRLERCCRAGGRIFLTVPSGAWESYSYQQASMAIDRPHVHHFEQRDLREIFGKKEDFHVEYLSARQAERGDLLGWWIISYTNTPHRPTGRVNYQRKWLTTVPRNTIAACLIVKNEEDNIVRCIKSFLDVVDEVWVWDCGSTDQTMGLVRRFDRRYWPKLYCRQLNLDPDGDGLGNFAFWRNQSIGETQADYCLWIDADEVLIDARNFRKYANDAALFNGYVIKQNHMQLHPDESLPADEPQRLFRNQRGYKFFGVIHEQVAASLNEEIQPSLVLPDVDILHYGYLTQEETRRKCVERNMPLVRKDRLRHPDRMLGPLLVLRDYINLAQFAIERTGGRLSEQATTYLCSSVMLYLEHYASVTHKYHAYAAKHEQAALRFLGTNGVPVKKEWGIPFEVKIQLALGVGGTDGRPLPPIQSRWFSGVPEFMQYLQDEMGPMVNPLWPGGIKFEALEMLPPRTENPLARFPEDAPDGA